MFLGLTDSKFILVSYFLPACCVQAWLHAYPLLLALISEHALATHHTIGEFA